MRASRLIFKELISDLNSESIIILLGPRQVGKTFLLKELREKVEASGKRTAYFNLEIPHDLEKFAGGDKAIFELLTTSGEVVFIDEFHYVKNLSHILKAVYDSDHKVKIFASGSSSMEIHKHLKESMAGRRQIRQIYPLSLEEYSQLPLPISEHLVTGGLPGLLHVSSEEAKQEYLEGILETYLLKDIKSLIKEENIKAFNHLLFQLAEHQGQVISTASLGRDIGLSHKGVERYLTLLEQTFVCFGLPSFSTNQSNELKKSKKYYFYDLGIRNALVRNFGDDVDGRVDKGLIYESQVFLELQQKVKPNSSLHFWRTKAQDEVDFILVINRKPIPVEVKSNLNSLSVPKGLRKFLKRYPDAPKAYVVNNQIEGDQACEGRIIHFIKWQNCFQIGL